MRFVPREHQVKIANFILENKRCAIWSYMGSGKTTACLDALDVLKIVGCKGKTLIVSPKTVARDVWPGETRKFDAFRHFKVSVLIGTPDERDRALRSDSDIYSVSFDLLPWLQAHPDCPNFTTIIVDESSKLRNFRGSFQRHPKTGKVYLRSGGVKRGMALARLAWKSSVERFVELTGTPSPKGVANLWGQIWFLDRGKRLGNSFKAFANRWFIKDFSGYGIRPRPGADEEIASRISDLVLIVKPSQIDLPVIVDVPVKLPDEARAMYRAAEKAGLLELSKDNVVTAMNVAARMGKCSQIANGAVYDAEGAWHAVHDEKLEALDRIVEEFDGTPILVAYTYKHDLARLRKSFPQGVALEGKAETIAVWNKGQIPLMFLHPASAGHGNNFQDGGNVIVFFGLDWDLELYQQVIERIGPARQKQSGHDRPVFVYRIVAEGTIDEQKLVILDGRASAQDALREKLSNI